MAHKSLLLAAYFASISLALSEGGARKGTDISGKYEQLNAQALCPTTISHAQYHITEWGYSIRHGDIFQNRTQCTSKSSLSVMNWKLLQETGLATDEVLLEDKILGPIFSSVGQHANVLHFGIEFQRRECGAYNLNPGTGVLFLQPRKKVIVPGVAEMFPGAMYMLVFEAGAEKACTYFKGDRRVALGIPKTTVSPKPMQAARSPLAPPHTPPSDLVEIHSCFPGNAVVETAGGEKFMRDVRLGDRLLVAPGVFSEVFMFTHRDLTVSAAFVEIQASGRALHLTPGHFIYANRGLVAARNVQAGDFVILANGSMARVEAVRDVLKSGLYNPQTIHGDIVVNGITASSYTEAVMPRAAHALLAPLRALFCTVFGSLTTAISAKY